MTLFKFFRKRSDIEWVTLPEPDDSCAFFSIVKTESEKLWAHTIPSKGTYGFQIQKDSKWRPGLSDTQILKFEKDVGFSFPQVLRNFYKTMNGITMPGINLYGDNKILPTYRSVFYSYPDDVCLIKENINLIYESKSVSPVQLEGMDVSRIFPVFQHRFMLIDITDNPILSMYGSDIIYYAENLSKLLANEIFGSDIYNISDFESPPQGKPTIKFWLD